MDKNNKILYIGKTTHAFTRIKFHQQNWDDIVKDFRFIACRECDLNKYEKRWILRFMPSWNTSLKPRKSEYKKKQKAPKYERRMKLRKLTKKSLLLFGTHKEWTVDNMLKHGKIIPLIEAYYNLSHITFFDEILEELKISEEWRIEKPGVDKERGIEFKYAIHPDFMAKRVEMYHRLIKTKAVENLKYANAATRSKSFLRDKNRS